MLATESPSYQAYTSKIGQRGVFQAMWFDRLIDNKIRDAEEKGLFKNLRGQGKPLRMDEGHGPEWLANHLLQESDLLPEWLELRKEISAVRPDAVAALREYREKERALDPSQPGERAILNRLEERFVQQAVRLNKLIDLHNLRCPSRIHELPRMPEDLLKMRSSRPPGEV